MTAISLSGATAWVITTDHKRVGRLFMRGAFLCLLGVVAAAAALGVERVDSGSFILGKDSIVQLFAFVRTGLAVLVMAPLFVGLSIAIVPLQVGAQTIAFARLALFGFYAWLIGAAAIIYSIIANGGPSGGNVKMVDAYLLGVALAVVGLFVGAICVATTVVASRSVSVPISQVPVYAWSALAGAIGLIVTLPVHLGSIVYVAVDHHFGRAVFGGNYGIDKWVGDLFAAPQILIYAIPVLGVIAEVASVNGRMKSPLRNAAYLGVGVMSTALLGAVTRTQHYFEFSGSLGDKLTSAIPFALFTLLPLLGILIVLGVSMLTFKSNSPSLHAPLVPALLGVGMVLTGMLGNAVQMISSTKLSGTVFAEGVSVYIGYGMVLVAIGAIIHWGSELNGKSFPDSVVITLGVAGFMATVLAALPYYIAGFADQASDSVSDFDYAGPHALWNAASSAGHALMIVVVIAFTLSVLKPTKTVGVH